MAIKGTPQKRRTDVRKSVKIDSAERKRRAMQLTVELESSCYNIGAQMGIQQIPEMFNMKCGY